VHAAGEEGAFQRLAEHRRVRGAVLSHSTLMLELWALGKASAGCDSASGGLARVILFEHDLRANASR
jgi:hypothetical protein